MTRYARLKKDTEFIILPATKGGATICIPYGTIVEVTNFEVTSVYAPRDVTFTYRLQCGDDATLISIDESNEYLEFLND